MAWGLLVKRWAQVVNASRKVRDDVRSGPLHLVIRRGTPLLAAVALALAVPGGMALAQTTDRAVVVDFIDQTGELLDRAGDIVRDSGSLQARRVLDEATRLHRRSQTMLDQGTPAMTLSTSRRARAATFHAMRLAREALVFSERYQLLAERYARRGEDLLDKARSDQNQQALELLDQAEHQDMRARDRANQGDFRQACRILDQVETLQHRAAGVLGVGPAPENLDRLLARTAARLDEAVGLIDLEGGQRSLVLLRDAESALDQAHNFQARGMPLRALQLVKLARDLLDKAMLGPAVEQEPADSARRQIENWDVRRSRIPEDLDADSTAMLTRARDHRRRADALLVEGKPLMALRQIKLAHDLLDQVERRSR